ncbi:MAG: iron ABC transporter permease, partial [Oscillospiraceae bacterium]|nr:iron ABC transporter permease [Oscillospiraceae bacterium]
MKKEQNILYGNTSRFWLCLIILAVALVLGFYLNIQIGSVSINVREVLSLSFKGLKYWFLSLFSKNAYSKELEAVIKASTESQILFKIRFPRMLLTAFLGGALAVSGYLLQVFFRNPIAGPFVLGISSGAKMVVGVTLIFLSPFLGDFGSGTLILAAFLGSIIITVLVLMLSQKVKNMSMLLVAGIMVGYICSAVTDFCVTFANEHDVVNLTHWSMGSFSGANWADVRAGALFCCFGLIAAMLLTKPMAAYALGEGYAKSLGIPIRAVRAGIILVSSLLSACVTALAGPISFVGIA